MSPVKAADPDAAALDAAFAEAMGAPARPREPAAPPEIDPDAPHGRGDDGTPLAPHGLTKDGKPKRTPAGRKPKDDQPRTGPAAPHEPGKPGKAGTIPAARDYREPLDEFADALWLGLTGIGMVGGKIPLIGRYIPEQKIAAEAAVFHAEKTRLVTSVNIAAQHNAQARRFAEKCADGTTSWVLMCGFMAMPFLTMSAAVWQGDKALAGKEMPSLAELAKRNEAEMDSFIAGLAEQLSDREDAGESEAA